MIVVFGSVAIDLVTNVDRLPKPGETVLCGGYVLVPGSKGGNQAVAAARAGAKVAHIGTCGKDEFATLAKSTLLSSGVDLSHHRTGNAPTCVCLITVDRKAENSIVVASGANMETTVDQLEECRFGAGDTVILQREIRDEETFAAVALAKQRGARVVLNVAPASPVPAEILKMLDILIVNEHEAAIVAEAAGIDSADLDVAARELNRIFGCATVVTLGPQGAIGWNAHERYAVEAPTVEAVDTTAAGDSFIGAFAAALDLGMSFAVALQRGVIAGSLCCTKAGAQPSIPYAKDIDLLVAA